jgi:hypothetical protein
LEAPESVTQSVTMGGTIVMVWKEWANGYWFQELIGGSKHHKHRELLNLSKMGYNSRFRYRTKKFEATEAMKILG